MAVFKDQLKDPDSVLDWIFDWNDWLGDFETITDVVFEATPGIVIDQSVKSQKTATVWLSGGTEGQVFKVTCRITTSEGRTEDRSFTLRCTNR